MFRPIGSEEAAPVWVENTTKTKLECYLWVKVRNLILTTTEVERK
jgi:hypothetical protein